MNTTYTQKSTPVQKAADSKATSVLDNSSQSESLQRKADMANNATQRAEAPRPNNTGMPDNLKAGIESLSGFSMDDVRVHYNSSKPATVQAFAYTQGTDIHVAPGQEKCLPHEAWHVAQQMAGRVSPTTNINGMPVNDNAGLEHEADVMGEKAVTQRKENVEIKSKNVPGRALQLKPGEDNDMVCSADILYRNFGGDIKHVKGVGYNNPSDKATVLDTFNECGLENLGRGDYEKTNPPGQCAEPHAVADALRKIPSYERECLKNMGETESFGELFNQSKFLDVYVSDSVVRKLTYNDDEMQKIKVDAFPQTDNASVNAFSRCETCAQWIGSDNHVYPNYLEISPTEKNLLEQQRCYSKYEEKKLEKLDSLNERMSFKEKTFHNVRFLVQTHTQLSDWFKNDKEIQNIDEQNGLRTIIKKQLLKNRICEMANKAQSELSILTENSDYKFPDTHILSSNDIEVLPEKEKLYEIVEQYRNALKWETENKTRLERSAFLQTKIKQNEEPTKEVIENLPDELQKLLEVRNNYQIFYNSCVKQCILSYLGLTKESETPDELEDFFKWLQNLIQNKPCDEVKQKTGRTIEEIKEKIGETFDDFKNKFNDFAKNGYRIKLGMIKKNIMPKEKNVENSADLAKKIRHTINDEREKVVSLIDKIADIEKAQRWLARLDYYRELMGIQGEITGLDEAETLF